MELISRQAAIDAIDSFAVLDGYQDQLELRSKIEKLPSAKNKAFEEMKAELYEREVQAKADKECYPDNEYLEGVFDGLHEASKLMSFVVPTADLSEYCDKLWKTAYERGKAEKIIRCKDCKWWLPPHGCNDTAGLIYTTENAFCSFAERRTEERMEE